MKKKEYDAIIIGSGFGGSMVAKKLYEAGWNLAIIERGDWVKRGPWNWASNASIDLTPNYDKSLPYHVIKGGNKDYMGTYSAVGGPSVFYGGVSFSFREEDFDPPGDIVGQSEAQWPISYSDLEPFYDEAEKILQIAGESSVDPTEPYRRHDFPQKLAPYAKISKKVKESAESLGLHPFHLPLAINYNDTSRNLCQFCTTCDTFVCAVGAKNDLETMVINKLHNGQPGGGNVDIYANTMAYNISAHQKKVDEIKCVNTQNGTETNFQAKVCILSAGALASPHLILNSQLESLNPAGHIVGRFLMRHVNAIVFGAFPGVADKQHRFHKELAILDFYFGHKDIPFPKNKLGSLQQVPTPPDGLVENEAPKLFGKLASKLVKLLTGLLAIAEDQPQYQNYIKIDRGRKAKYNMAGPILSHEYSNRDLAAVNALIKEAKKIMKKSGALMNYVHHIRTFSHSVGTIRMGVDPSTSPLDKFCNFRGIDNLYVVDASFMPTSAALNPSLTISANSLRVGEHIIDKYS